MKNLNRKEVREKRQLLYNAENYMFNEYEFETGSRVVYDNFNFSIFVDDYCNADCGFCVAQLRYENKGQLYKRIKINDDVEYLKRLEEILIKVRPLNPSVSLTGGEPTKSSKLIPILKLLEKYNFRKRTITSNGSGLFDIVEGKPVIQYLIDYHITHLNISRAHYKENINKKIMKFKTNENYTSNELIEKISNYLKGKSPHIRMSCLLLKNGINSIEEMKKYMDYYINKGIDNFIFRELMDYDKNNMCNVEKMNYCRNNKIKLNNIWSVIDNDSLFKFKLNLLGYYYYVEIYDYKTATMASESANLIKLELEKNKHRDNVYEMVFHPNGNLNGSWVETEDILDEYKGY